MTERRGGDPGIGPSRSVLFVCLGNICRSPLAEGIFLSLAAGRGARFRVESRGLGGWHAGERADHRSVAVARRHGITLTGRATVVDPARDFAEFGVIVPMDRANRRGLIGLGADPDRVMLMRSFDPALSGALEEVLDVPDPYTGDERAFEEVYEMLVKACDGLLMHLLADG